jgi:solute carrier family 50 protein (sugar transporter)
MEEPEKWDLERNEEKSKQLQLVINDSTNDKS